MSWSINLIGTPKNITAALDKYSEQINGQSKTEFDAVLPHIKGILNQNVNDKTEPVLKLEGYGHASGSYSNCTVKVEPLPGVLC